MRINILLLLIFAIGFTYNLDAQSKLNEGTAKAALSKIFDLSKEQNYPALASLLLYEEGKELRSYNYSVKEEKKLVSRNGKRIKAYLNLSDSYEYNIIKFGKLFNNPSAELKVQFKSGDQKLTISFIFIELSGKIFLADFK